MIYSLQDIPRIEIISKPSVSEVEEGLLGDCEDYLSARTNLFNGPILHVAGYRSGILELFLADYTWTIARSEGYLTDHTLGQMSVALSLSGPDGFLWQRRSKKVLCPGVWDFSATGGADTPDLEAAIEEEAWEEIGQSVLPGLRARKLLVSRRYGVSLLFTARWNGEDIRTNDEISEVRWQDSLPGRSTPQCQILTAEGW